jgi:hypothetical protein
MDRAERRARTQRIIERRVRSRRAASGSLYLDRPPEPWRAPYLYDVVVGFERRWTFYKWIVEPGTLRKHNGAHGSCGVCDREESLARDQPSLAWEVQNLLLAEVPPEPEASRRSEKPRRRKNTKRWCRGKAGVSHRASWRSTGFDRESQLLACDACGKKLDWCFHTRWPFSKRPCHCPRGLATLARGPPRSLRSAAGAPASCSGESR